ncbi:MAG: hypothetical protein R3C05_12410 [Pirellulaceae bacterium]
MDFQLGEAAPVADAGVRDMRLLRVGSLVGRIWRMTGSLQPVCGAVDLGGRGIDGRRRRNGTQVMGIGCDDAGCRTCGVRRFRD